MSNKQSKWVIPGAILIAALILWAYWDSKDEPWPVEITSE